MSLKHLFSGAPGWHSQLSVQLQLRSWSHNLWVRAPHRAPCWQLRAWSMLQILCLPLSLCPSPARALSLSLSLQISKWALKKFQADCWPFLLYTGLVLLSPRALLLSRHNALRIFSAFCFLNLQPALLFAQPSAWDFSFVSFFLKNKWPPKEISEQNEPQKARLTVLIKWSVSRCHNNHISELCMLDDYNAVDEVWLRVGLGILCSNSQKSERPDL